MKVADLAKRITDKAELEMHEWILKKIQNEIERCRSDLQLLFVVEAYHKDMVQQLEKNQTTTSEVTDGQDQEEKNQGAPVCKDESSG